MLFVVEGDNEITIRYDVKELINSQQPTKHQIYFYNTQLNGQARMEYHIEADGVRAS